MIRQALAIAVEIGDRRGEGNRTGHIGGILFAKADTLDEGPERKSMLRSAREHLMTALHIAEETGDPEKAGCWLMNLGNICLREENYTEAINRYREAVAMGQVKGFARLEAQARFNLGMVLGQMGDLPPALDHLRASSVLLRKMKHPMTAKVEAYVRVLANMVP